MVVGTVPVQYYLVMSTVSVDIFFNYSNLTTTVMTLFQISIIENRIRSGKYAFFFWKK